MAVGFTLWIATFVIILVSLVFSTALQMRQQRVSAKHHADLGRKLDEQRTDLAANRERLERRTQELRRQRPS